VCFGWIRQRIPEGDFYAVADLGFVPTFRGNNAVALDGLGRVVRNTYSFYHRVFLWDVVARAPSPFYGLAFVNNARHQSDVVSGLVERHGFVMSQKVVAEPDAGKQETWT
jgi:hypothetical protein